MVKYRRVYYDSVKKYGLKIGITSIPVVFLLFMLLAQRGDITITGYSGDMVCAGTELDPCYAYINFTANTDIYIYPNENWTFSTNPPVRKVILQRSWRDSWRTINLSKPWNKNVKYAIKFSKGKSYQIRFIGYKYYPYDDIKWGFGDIDPVWYGDKWISPSWSKEIKEVVEYNNGTRAVVDFDNINFADIDRAGLWLGDEKKNIAGFDKSHGQIILYPKGYDKPPVNLFVRIHATKGASTYTKWLTSNKGKPYWNEKILDDGATQKELGYYTNLTYNIFTFPCSIGIRGDTHHEKWKIPINVSTPIDLDDISVEYIFAVNPDSAKKMKYVRVVGKNGSEQYRLNKLIDKSGEITHNFYFLDENNNTISFVDFEKEFNLSNSQEWKIKRVTLPNGQFVYVLSIRFSFGSLDMDEVLSLNADWTTPSSVESYSSQSSLDTASKSIDDSTSSYWDENIGNDKDGPTYEWYITYDMGDTYTISKIRIYADGDESYNPCKVGIIKVCDDPDCNGESNLLSSACSFSTKKEWQECSFTATSGRYIEVRGGIRQPFGDCVNKINYFYTQDFYEFDAYVESGDTSPPSFSNWQQQPPDLNSSSLGKLYINVTITDDSGVNESSVKFYHWINDSQYPDQPWCFLNGTAGDFEHEHTMTNTSSVFNITLHTYAYNPSTHNVHPETMRSATKYNYSLDSNNKALKVRFYNISTHPNTTFVLKPRLYRNSGNLLIYYCNSSYTTGKVYNSDYCIPIATLTSQEDTNYQNTYFYGDENSLLDGIKITSTGYIVFYAEVGSDWEVAYANIDSNSVETTGNGGTSWTNQDYSADTWLIQLNGNGLTTVGYKVYACDNVGNCDNSTVQKDTYAIHNFAPSPAPEILVPENSTYSGIFNITWTASKDPNSDPFNYSIYLYHSNNTLAAILADNNITEGTEYYTFDSTGYPNGQYYLMANATDDVGNTNFYIMPYYFTLDNNPPFWSDNSTNSTLAGSPILHSLKWYDNDGLSGYIFSFYNGSNTTSCDGTLDCSGLSSAQCQACSQCSYTAENCSGTPNSCDSYSSQSDCELCGCTWSGGGGSYNTYTPDDNDFVCTLRASGGDYSKINDWRSAIACDLTDSSTKIFTVSDRGNYDSSDDGKTVTFSGGGTGTLKHISTFNKALIVSCSGTINTGTVTISSGHTFTISDTGQQVGDVVLSLYNDWANGYDEGSAYIDIKNFVTDANHKVVIWTNASASGTQGPNRHNGTAESGFFVNETGSSYTFVFRISHVLVEGIEIQQPSKPSMGVFYMDSGLNNTFRNLLIHNVGGIVYHGEASTIENSIIYDFGSSGYSVVRFNKVRSCSILAMGSGSYSNQIIVRNAECYNVLVYNNNSGTGYNDYYSCTGDYNIGSDSSAPGSHSQHNKALSDIDFVSTTPGSEDLHIQSTSCAKDAGTDLSSYFTDDIDACTRSGTWDIGADEYDCTGGGGGSGSCSGTPNSCSIGTCEAICGCTYTPESCSNLGSCSACGTEGDCSDCSPAGCSWSSVEFVNDSWVSMSGTTDWSNVTKVVNSTVGATIKWKVYANDSNDNWNVSDVFTYITTSGGAPSVTFDINHNTTANIIRFVNCSPDWAFYPTYPENQTTNDGIINATNDGTQSGNFEIEYVGTLNTGWTLWACNASTNDPKTSSNCVQLTNSWQLIWYNVAVDEQKDIWLYGNCSYVTANPRVGIDMQAVS